MSNFNNSISAYLESDNVKYHEVALLELIANDFSTFNELRVLDIGCATGSFIRHMLAHYPGASYDGFDISPELIERANAKNGGQSCRFFVCDALAFAPKCKYDVIIASGVMSIYDDFRVPLEKWVQWLKDDGVLYIFGRFNSKDIDTVIHFRNNFTNSSEWEGGLTSYSLKTVGDFCNSLGFDARFTRFYPPISLPEREDPIRTFTRETSDGGFIVINGANIVAEHFFLRLSHRSNVI